MPLCKSESVANGTEWALWHIEEEMDDLWHQLNPSPDQQHELQFIHHPQKKLEWLASRLVIRHLVSRTGHEYSGVYKDAFGKPHLTQLPLQISIAHSFPFAVAAIHRSQPVGIDIEYPRKKLLKIRDRFLNPEEAKMTGDNLRQLCIFWAGKEVLYKIYGRKKLIFKQHMHLSNHSLDTPDLIGSITYDGYQEKFQIKVDQFRDYFIAIGSSELLVEHGD